MLDLFGNSTIGNIGNQLVTDRLQNSNFAPFINSAQNSNTPTIQGQTPYSDPSNSSQTNSTFSDNGNMNQNIQNLQDQYNPIQPYQDPGKGGLGDTIKQAAKSAIGALIFA